MDKREQAFILRDAGVPIATVAARLNVSKGRISQLVREHKQRGATTTTPDGDAASDDERLLRARADLVERQAHKLDIELQVRRQELIGVDEVKGKFGLLMRHLNKAMDDMRRKGMNDALDILNAAIDAMLKDAKRTLPYVDAE